MSCKHVVKLFRYGGNSVMTVLFSMIYGATVFAITTPGMVPDQVLWFGQAANIPMVVLGKMIQVIANFRQGTDNSTHFLDTKYSCLSN